MGSTVFFALLALIIAPQLIAANDLDDLLSPILAPALDSVCKEVECGKGRCRASTNSSTILFTCECDSGWKKTQSNDDHHFGFLPCVIPDCSLDYACAGAAVRNETKVIPSNFSITDPCSWADCGGGSCNKTSSFGHTCNCNAGYSNLMNITSLPCLKQCSIGMDCSALGVTISNRSSSASTPGMPENGEASSALQREYSWMVLLMIPLAMIM